jgi:tripartite ATP-independent transporter DctM subunit
MDASLGLYLVLIFVALIAFGVPIAIAIGGSSVAVLLIAMPVHVAFSTAGQKMVTGIDSFALLAVPLFIMAGNIMNHGGIARRLVDFAYLFVGRIPGSISHVNVVANMLFGAVSGSAVAAVAAVGKTLLPEAKESGMDIPLFTAANIASGPTGQIIPPSNGMIVYSVVSGGTSIGALFLAGYIPGIIMGLCSMIVVAIYLKIHPEWAGKTKSVKYTMLQVLNVIWRAFPSLAMIIVVIGGIIAGIYTATEAACSAVVYALILSALYKQINLKILNDIAKDTLVISSLVLFLIGASSVMSYVLAYTQLPLAISNAVLSVTDSPVLILLFMNVILLIVGMFMDLTPALLIFTPIFLPISTQIGIDPVHFGIIMMFNLCVGITTPPVGAALFVGCSISDVSIEKATRRLIPFFVATIIGLMIVTYVPALSLTIPRMAGMIQ